MVAKQNQTVELREFIKVALTSIVSGITDSQAMLKQEGSSARINPLGVQTEGGIRVINRLDRTEKNLMVETIEFDVAVTSESMRGHETSGEGGIDIKVLRSAINTGWEKQQAETLASRIKFSVNVVFPSQPK